MFIFHPLIFPCEETIINKRAMTYMCSTLWDDCEGPQLFDFYSFNTLKQNKNFPTCKK